MLRIHRSRLDIKFSKYIRLRAKGRCEYCLKPKEFKELQCSHFHGRRKMTVRFDPDNACALDFACHQFLGENPDEHTAFFKKRLGERGYQALMVRARVGHRADEKLIELWLDQELKRYN